MLGFAFGSYFDYAPGSFHFRNIAYNIATNCYQWTERIAQMEAYFHNNLAINCYNGFSANWDVANSYSGKYGTVPTYGHRDTSVNGNIFAAIARNGLVLYRSGQSSGLPRSFEGNYAMDYNIWYRVGYDNRTDSVYRRGVADIGYEDSSLSNGGNPTSTLAGLKAKEPAHSIHDLAANPNFASFDVDVYSDNIISQAQASTLTSYITNDDIDWTSFALQSSSPAIDQIPSLPSELIRVLNIWSITPEQSGTSFDVGPLEYGITWTAASKGPQPPTASPTKPPSYSPTSLPTLVPSVNPTVSPSKSPSQLPTSPSQLPTVIPSRFPTLIPSLKPSISPSNSIPASTLLPSESSSTFLPTLSTVLP
jgi:hypothetical protein